VDKVPDSAGYDDYFCCWLKGVRVEFLLEEGPLRSSGGIFPAVVALVYIGV